MSTRIEDKIVDGVQVVVNSALNGINLDKTLKAIIVELVDKDTKKYKVKYQDAQFYAYAIDNRTYSKNTYVYIRVPNGDMSNTKTIISKVNENTVNIINPYSRTEIFCRFNDLKSAIELDSMDNKTEIVLFDESKATVDNKNTTNYLKDSEYWSTADKAKILFLGMMFTNDVMEVNFIIEPEEQLIQDIKKSPSLALCDYGFKIYYTDSSCSGDEQLSIKISINDFIGNPYQKNEQSFYYNVLGGRIVDINFYIKKIIFYRDEEIKNYSFNIYHFNLYGARKNKTTS